MVERIACRATNDRSVGYCLDARPARNYRYFMRSERPWQIEETGRAMDVTLSPIVLERLNAAIAQMKFSEV